MRASIRHGLTGVFRFSGRTAAGQFWPYAVTLFILMVIGWVAVFMPELNAAMGRMQRFAAEHPELATVTHGPGGTSISIEGSHPDLMPDFRYLMSVMGVLAGLFVLLIAAAVVRRLHDSDRSALWALPPLVLIFTGLWGMRHIVGSFDDSQEPDIALFGLIFLNNLAYLASLAVLVVQLVRSSTPGPNRFGPAPPIE